MNLANEYHLRSEERLRTDEENGYSARDLLIIGSCRPGIYLSNDTKYLC